MTVLAEVLIPADTFGPSELFEEYPDVRVEFERVVPLTGRSHPLLRILGMDGDDGAAALRACSSITVVDSLTDPSGGKLYAVRPTNERNEVMDAFGETDVHVLQAVGGRDSWEFRARFGDHHELVEFNQHLTQQGVPVTLQRLYNSTPEDPDAISEKQREAVRLALRRGYFEIPRQCTIEDLSRSVGISDSAFSQRLRRGIEACLRTVLDE